MPKHMLATISLGSNLEPRREFLALASVCIARHIGPIAKASSLYESEPWGFEAGTSFINQILRVNTRLPAPLVLRMLLEIEQQLGRTRQASGYASRTIDLDLLLYGSQALCQPGLTVPHPRIHLRRFVLVPLAEIDPFGIHPLLGQTWRELLDRCDDACWVRKME